MGETTSRGSFENLWPRRASVALLALVAGVAVFMVAGVSIARGQQSPEPGSLIWMRVIGGSSSLSSSLRERSGCRPRGEHLRDRTCSRRTRCSGPARTARWSWCYPMVRSGPPTSSATTRPVAFDGRSRAPGSDIAIDPNGDLIGGGVGSEFLTKFDTDGAVIWKQAVEGASLSRLSVADDGSIFAAGRVLESAVFDAGLPSEREVVSETDIFGDAFVARFSADGSLMWLDFVIGAQIKSVAVDGAGDVVVAGIVEREATLGSAGTSPLTLTKFRTPILNRRSRLGMFFAKYSDDGEVLWAKLGPKSDRDNPVAALPDAEGNIVLSGSFRAPSAVFAGGFRPGNDTDHRRRCADHRGSGALPGQLHRRRGLPLGEEHHGRGHRAAIVPRRPRRTGQSAGSRLHRFRGTGCASRRDDRAAQRSVEPGRVHGEVSDWTDRRFDSSG